MKRLLLFTFIIFLFSCKPVEVLMEENILKMELSTRMGSAPLTIEVNCKITPSVKDIPCLDEEWYCWPGETPLSIGDYFNKLTVENDCRDSFIKKSFSMDFTFEIPGTYTIELILKKKNGEVFARISSIPIIVKSR